MSARRSTDWPARGSAIATTRGADPSRRHERPHQAPRAGRVARAGISDLEIGYSARTAAEWDAFHEAAGVFSLIETYWQHMQRARQVQRVLASRSQRGRRSQTFLIAAAAEEAGLIVLHYDAGFDRIAAATGQACESIVPAGSID